MIATTLCLRHALQMAVLLVAAAACSPAPPPASEKAPDLPTVEVTAAPDAAYSIEGDRVEQRANPNAMAGALPDGFPAEAAAVSGALQQKLRAAGWQAGTAGNWTKAGRKLRLVVEATPAGARFRYDF